MMKYQMGKAAAPKKKRGHTLPKRPLVSLDELGILRVGNLLWILGCSHSTLYAGLPKAGETTARFPGPDGWDPRPYWLTSTIKAFLETRRPRNQLPRHHSFHTQPMPGQARTSSQGNVATENFNVGD